MKLGDIGIIFAILATVSGTLTFSGGLVYAAYYLISVFPGILGYLGAGAIVCLMFSVLAAIFWNV